jgi:rhamnogalacturonyl hydrolase YesR
VQQNEEKILQSIFRVGKWVEDRNYRGYEYSDGLSSPLKALTFGNLFLERCLLQLVRLSPVNIRPLVGVRPLDSTKGRGYMAWGYLTMFRLTKDPIYEEKTRSCLRWLDENKAKNYEGHSWGNHFDFSSRSGRTPKLEPIIVWTSLIGQAFLDGYELLGEEQYLDIAKSICRWILALPRERTDHGTCLSYVAFTQGTVHNSNMLGAAMLARTARITGARELKETAAEAMEYSCTRQLPEGGWYYGEDPKFHWVDNFHSGYNLDSLKCYLENTNDMRFEKNLKRGFEYYMKSFFESDGTPRYYNNKKYPVDIQCASQAITTLANFSDIYPEVMDISLKVANWTIDNMQDKKGYFYYRVMPWGKVKVPLLHWGQATMYRGLTLLYSKLKYSDSKKGKTETIS